MAATDDGTVVVGVATGWLSATGTAPGCGAGGISGSAADGAMVRVGDGWRGGGGRATEPVGAGKAAVPGFAAGYDVVVDGCVVLAGVDGGSEALSGCGAADV